MKGAKKIWALVFVLTLALVLGACGSSGGNSSNSKVLTVWAMGDEAKQLPDLVKDFEKESGIKVKIQAIPWSNAHDKLLTAVASKSGPDVVQMGATWMPEFVKAGALMDITKETEKKAALNEDKFYPASIKTVKYDDKMYGVPWYADTRVLYYRTDLLKKVGYDKAPATWEELHDAGKKLADRGKDMYGFSLDGKEQTVGFMYGKQNGSPLLKDGKPVFNQKPFVDAVKYMDSFFKDGISPKEDLGLDISQSFGGDGVVPMFVSGPWMVKTIQETVPDVKGKWATSVLPKGKNNNSPFGGANLSVFNYSKNKTNAVKFLEYMSKPDVQLKWMKMTTSLPTGQKAWEDKSLKENQFYKTFGEQIKHAEPSLQVPQYEELAQSFLKNFEQIYRGGANVQKQMDKYNQEATSILKK